MNLNKQEGTVQLNPCDQFFLGDNNLTCKISTGCARLMYTAQGEFMLYKS